MRCISLAEHFLKKILRDKSQFSVCLKVVRAANSKLGLFFSNNAIT